MNSKRMRSLSLSLSLFSFSLPRAVSYSLNEPIDDHHHDDDSQQNRRCSSRDRCGGECEGSCSRDNAIRTEFAKVPNMNDRTLSVPEPEKFPERYSSTRGARVLRRLLSSDFHVLLSSMVVAFKAHASAEKNGRHV